MKITHLYTYGSNGKVYHEVEFKKSNTFTKKEVIHGCPEWVQHSSESSDGFGTGKLIEVTRLYVKCHICDRDVELKEVSRIPIGEYSAHQPKGIYC